MEKIDVVLVVLNKNALDSALKNLNFDNVNLVAIIIDNDTDEKFFLVNEEQIPLESFTTIPKHIRKYKKFIWLISGYIKSPDDIYDMREFLLKSGVPKENIVNFDTSWQMSPTWLANLRYIEEHGADFFVTGNEDFRKSLDLNYIPRIHADADSFEREGINLAHANQNLKQGFLTAKHIFENVERGRIKFVLIGLTPNYFIDDSRAAFFSRSVNLQYMSAFEQPVTGDYDSLLEKLLNNEVKEGFIAPTSEQEDLNFENAKEELALNFSTTAIVDWKKETTPFPAKLDEKKVKILKDYIKLCLENEAKPIGVILPGSPMIRKYYSKERLKPLQKMLGKFEKDFDFTCIDTFRLNLNYEYFYDMKHLNLKGIAATNAVISFQLCMQNLIPFESFRNMNYEYLDYLANFVSKSDYNMLMEYILKASAQEIAKKNKIKIGFVLRGASEWCGDELYNLFAEDKRFEPTVFLFLRSDNPDNELVLNDFLNGIEQFKSHGLNVYPLDSVYSVVPPQDIFIFLTPYFDIIPFALRPENITAKTLRIFMHYAFDIGLRPKSFHNREIFHTAWRVYCSSSTALKIYNEESRVGMPRGFFSGYPRIDFFFKEDANLNFEWKKVRPDAKKIIYAPHWSIIRGVKQATFQWNYQFMYKFAKAHQEISWVIKPHPGLYYSVVEAGVFPSVEAFEEYLQAWDNLPNGRFYTGAYYQDIFATSDGMILDSCSFIGEYQYVDKPMIFLTREEEEFNTLGNEILNASYLVDGKDFEGIAALMQQVFIQGDDFKADERKKIFDEHLNYPALNGMLASEFIHKNIADGLQEKPLIGYVPGVYDIFDAQYLRKLKEASRLCNKLIVGVIVDKAIKDKEKYPTIPFNNRMTIIRSNKYVDKVIPEDATDKFALWEKFKFDILFVTENWEQAEDWEETLKKFRSVGVRII